MKLLITGASGFTGRHMVNHLLSLDREELDLYGLYNSTPPAPIRGCTYIRGDLSNPDDVYGLIRSISPDAIIHLAGANRGSLHDLFTINVIGTENLLEALHQEISDCKVLVVGSSAEYGYSGYDPISEDAPLRPLSAYGISKVAEDLLAQSYARKDSLPIAVARPFNLIGPGQPASFVSGRIIDQVIEIEMGLRKVMQLGYIGSSRDFIDVRDVVSAYWQILSHECFEDLFAGSATNIGSGTATPIKELLETLELVTKRQFIIQMSDESKGDLIPSQRSDNTRITTATQWKPSISLRRSLEDMLEQKRAAFQEK